ncbi:DedA family protein [Leeia oryzae]|uniref:DedA family protein n=1 Tax=Leeia oryzae TaxID=356662 RepID=UPI0003712B67|nr:DedA family protein [Leeia oryzae]
MFIIDFILHIDVHLQALFAQYGLWIYGILFAIVFCETGLIVTPFLPGDSLLFAAGALTVGSGMSPHLLVLLLILAALSGDNVNYLVGRKLGMTLFSNPDSRIFRRDYLDRTHAFFAKHGGKTIIAARFVPIIRTYVPFTAGAGGLRYRRFIGFSVLGATLWVTLLVYAGYLFGNLPWVRSNFTTLILAIIAVSFLPMVLEYIRHKRAGIS